MPEVIEDALTRQREMQENFRKKAEEHRKYNASQELIDHYEELSKMSWWEYQSYLKDMEECRKQSIIEYAKNNPIKKEIVDKIYEKLETLEYKHMAIFSRTSFDMMLNPLEFMSGKDYEYELYETFLSHARDLYREKYSKEEEEFQKELEKNRVL